MRRKQAIAEFTRYVRELANKVPAGVKASELRSNLRAVSTLEKLAIALKKRQNLIAAVDEVYANKSAAYRHRVVDGLIRGFKKQADLGSISPQMMAALRSGAIGAGVGGLAGAGASMFQPKKKRQTLRNVLLGAGLGGLTGAGLSSVNSARAAQALSEAQAQNRWELNDRSGAPSAPGAKKLKSPYSSPKPAPLAQSPLPAKPQPRGDDASWAAKLFGDGGAAQTGQELVGRPFAVGSDFGELGPSTLDEQLNPLSQSLSGQPLAVSPEKLRAMARAQQQQRWDLNDRAGAPSVPRDERERLLLDSLLAGPQQGETYSPR